MPRRIVVASLLAVLIAGMAGVGTFAFGEWREAQIMDDLTRGGQVVYLRHADRHRGAKETLDEHSPLAAFADCTDQRNLTAEGREDAAQIGETFRRWNVPVGKVVALPLCRTRETARLAFGPGVVLD
ncbi:MAG: hypothetical protein ABW026_07800, partial [Microvirga sp.]